MTWKNTVEPDLPQMTIWRMRIACLIPKATNTHSEYVILIDFHCNNGYTNEPQCYVILTMPVLSVVLLSSIWHWVLCFVCTDGQACHTLARIPKELTTESQCYEHHFRGNKIENITFSHIITRHIKIKVTMIMGKLCLSFAGTLKSLTIRPFILIASIFLNSKHKIYMTYN